MLTTETFRKAARDPAEFGSYYLSHYFTRRSPPFHRQLSALWRRRVMKNRDPVSDCAAMLTEKGTRSAIAAPRGHAKSTVMSLQNVLHAALFGYKRYILLVSDTEAQAVSFLDAIKNELETNERILADFGEQPGKTWKTGSILLSNGCRIDAVGSGQKLRGRRNYERRPDLILCDDIENDEGVRTAEQRQKTADWFWKAVCKSGDSYTDILVIGTILHHDSLLAGLLENPGFQSRKYRAVLSDATSLLWTDWERLASDLSDPDREKTAHAFYFKHRKEMLAGSKVLWPEKLSYYDLRLMRLTEGDAAFNSEMQNQPIDPAACLFSAQWFRYYNPAEVDFRAADFRFYGYCSCKYKVFPFFDFYNINFRTRYDFQAALFCCFFVSIRNCKVCCIFIKNFRSVKFLYHFTWCFTFTKALNADVFLVFVIRFYHCLFKCICIYGNGDFCHALF